MFSDKTILRRSESILELKKLRIPKVTRGLDGANAFTNFLEVASGLISREHYPWFEDGRHALFWDLSDTSGIPVGLVKLKHGNWKQIAEERIFRKSNLKIPECLFYYSLGKENSAGLVHIERKPEFDQHSFSGSKLLLLLQWRRDKWVFEKQENETVLRTLLKESLGSLRVGRNSVDRDHLIKELATLAYRVSIEKQKGGTIVVLKPGVDKTDMRDFKLMGNALKFKPTGNKEDELIDRINLIAHDGASILYLCAQGLEGQWEWVHRGYLLPSSDQDEVKVRLINSLFESLHSQEGDGNTGNFNKHPLSLKGTRRWAAAVTAFNIKVQTAIVISQDGDIQIWQIKHDHINNTGSLNNAVLLYEVPQKGLPFRWNFEESCPDFNDSVLQGIISKN